jgi:hypothetical protein
MKKTVSEKTKRVIRNLFKELIEVYKSKKYKEEIINAESNEKNTPTFHLRFFKRGEESIYYRVLLNPEDNNLLQ